jgi:hypothetical protein
MTHKLIILPKPRLKSDLITLFSVSLDLCPFSLSVNLNITDPIFKCPNLIFLAQELMLLVDHRLEISFFMSLSKVLIHFLHTP